jgi:hypothetical protein
MNADERMAKLMDRVRTLLGQASIQNEHRHVKQPPGWEWQNMVATQAMRSGFRALRQQPPNYTRLQNTVRELEDVL